MHPAALVLATAMVLLPSTIFLGLWMASSSPSREEADFYVLPNTDGGQQITATQNRPPEFAAARPTSGEPSRQTPQRGFEDEQAPAGQGESRPALAENDTPQLTESDSPESDIQMANTTVAPSLPLTDGRSITRGRTQAVRAVIGRAVWDLQRQEQIGLLEGSYPSTALTALSASGSFFAAATQSPGIQGTEVVVWNTATGKKVLTASTAADRFVDAIVLANDRLLLGDRWSDELVVWDLETRRQRRPIRLADARFKQGNTSISHDGQFLSAVVNDQIRVFDAKEGGHVVTLQAAKSMSRRTDRAQPLYASLQSLVFSPDNQELAALTTTGTPQFVCWNGRGEVILETRPSGGFRPHDEVTWFRDRKAWLLGAHILDRSTSRVIASAVQVQSDHPSVELLDDDRLLVPFRSHPERLDIVSLPWDDMERAIQISDSDPAATLKAGRRVATRVHLDGLDSELSWELRRTLKKRLSELGLDPQETADVSIEIRVTSDSEQFVENRSLQLPVERRFDTVGRQAQGRAVVIEVIDRSQSEPVWSAVLCSDPERLQRKDDEPAAAVTARLTQDLAGVALPYYLPTDPQFLALPVLLTPPADSPTPPNLAIDPDAAKRMATQDQPNQQRQ